MNKVQDFILTFIGIFLSYTFYNRIMYQSKEDIERYQFNKLQKLLIESGKHVPYYKKLFQEINFNPKTDFNSIKDLKKIPILEQKIVRKDRNQFINKKYPFYIDMNTSGTSGTPFKASISFNHWVVEQAVIWRQWKSFNYNFRDKMAIIRSYSPKKNDKLIKVDLLRNFIFYSPYHLTDKNMEAYYEDMIKRDVKFLRGYPSSIKIFSEFCYRKNYKIENLKGIFLASETLSENDKDFIRKVFKVPVVNHYGLAECIVMFGNIGSDQLLYSYDDYGYLETIENKDNEHIVIGTNLNNYSMPLIRYNTNDRIVIKKNNIKSNINFKTIEKISGRKNEYIVSLDYKIPVTNLYTIFAKYTDITQFQIVQSSISSINIIILCPDDKIDNIKNSLFKNLNFLQKKEINFKIEFSSNFIRTGEGKISPFISYEKK